MRFQATKFREGYDQDEIDAFLVRAAEALEAQASGRPWTHLLTKDGVLYAKFQATKFREGYDQDQVDDFLDRVAVSLVPDAGSVPTTSTATPAGPPIARAMTPRGVLGLVLVAFMIGMVIYFVVSAT